ncbi:MULTISPECIES: hypothetical protein [Roseivirga]|uniref:Anti-sigma factor n=1 Tax=Roseivirga thermotolerans TaxID=1758176 RepID=A0ABQ3I6Q2_9BACT|nr:MULTISPECIES: hypothetical protein [Roseivirga]MEC7754809.1 hypothetical protein [Bacteroidota bacterium]GHE68901.1 hypothetical protein GCM10011340_25970 [Roseivirga thermotolerans]|tara:strand:- start:6290 stop:6838 length:549 start_codon:yes stop_codon:yes gene_type:complete
MQDNDKLEALIRNNRESFDSHEPRPENWQKIEAELGFDQRRDNKTQSLWLWKAAVILLLGVVAFLLADKYNQSEPLEEQLASVQHFEELETFYTSLINNKRERLSEVKGESSFDLQVEMKELDEIYSDLRELFLESQPSEQVLERLVHLLRQKLHVIDSQLEIIEQEQLPEEMKKEMEVNSL